MKRLLLAILMAFTLTTQADVVGVVSRNLSEIADSTVDAARKTANLVDTSTLSKQIYSDVKQALVGIAAALKVGVPHVYEVLVRQQVVKAITWSIVDGIIFLITILIWVAFMLDKEGKNSWWGAPVCVSIVLVLFCSFTITTVVTGFV